MDIVACVGGMKKKRGEVPFGAIRQGKGGGTYQNQILPPFSTRTAAPLPSPYSGIVNQNQPHRVTVMRVIASGQQNKI
jgi:hypothetical protein